MDALRPLLTTYAYNILGSLEEARDVVQDAFLKFMEIDADKIEDRKAYLVRTVINLSINRKKRQQKLISSYPGPWLPEPVATETADDTIQREDILSYSLMVLLEKLTAKQRAVFILKEAFDYEHEEIADALGITTENSRKLLSRAKVQLREYTPEEEKKVPAEYLNKYMQVIAAGDTAKLEQLLAEDITVVSDGGGKAAAFRKPIVGRNDVVSLLLGLHKKFYGKVRFEQRLINHQPALFYIVDDKIVTCQIFSLKNGHVVDIYFMRNPDKLKGFVLLP
jgi:RNA polymerase sigma factor (sigma-70 family)